MTSVPAPAPAHPDGKMVGRLVLVALGTLGAPLISIVMAVIWIFYVGLSSPSRDALILTAVFLALFLPVIVFSISSSWMFMASPESRLRLRRVIVGLSLGQVVCIAAVAVFGFVTQPLLWLPLTVIGCAVVFGAVGILLAPVFRSAPPQYEVVPLEGWMEPAKGKPILQRVAVGVFVLILGLALMGAIALNGVIRGHHGSELVIGAALLGAGFAFISAGLVCLVGSLRELRRLRGVASRDYAQVRRIRRAIRGARDAQLEPVDRERARAISILTLRWLPWQAASSLLTIAGTLSAELEASIVGQLSVGRWFAVIAGALLLVALVIFLRQIRALRRFVASHPASERWPGAV